MNVLVDTSIWSSALRKRKKAIEDPLVAEFRELIYEGRVELVGPVRQEILSGIRDRTQFEKLRNLLREFSDLELNSEDFERAVEIFNLCRASGIQGSNTDFLLCAVAEQQRLPIFTTDHDFQRFAKHCRIEFHHSRFG